MACFSMPMEWCRLWRYGLKQLLFPPLGETSATRHVGHLFASHPPLRNSSTGSHGVHGVRKHLTAPLCLSSMMWTCDHLQEDVPPALRPDSLQGAPVHGAVTQIHGKMGQSLHEGQRRELLVCPADAMGMARGCEELLLDAQHDMDLAGGGKASAESVQK